jgi:hypothetical protein
VSYRRREASAALLHVAQARQIVAHQRQRIHNHKANGCSTLDAEQTLGIFLRNLEIFERHESVVGCAHVTSRPSIDHIVIATNRVAAQRKFIGFFLVLD